MALIAENNLFALGAILFLLASLGFWADNHRLLRRTSGALWVIAGGVLLSNLQVTPFSATAYQFVFDYLVPLAIPLLLFKANLGKIFRESGAVMLTFLCASLATIIAAVAALFLVDIGENGPQVAGVIASGYIGGTMNFVAVARAVDMSPELFSVAIGANSVVSVIALMTLIAIPSIPALQRLVPSRIISGCTSTATTQSDRPDTPSFNLVHVSLAIGLSFTICAISFLLAERLGMAQYSILFVTAIAVAVATAASAQCNKLEGEFDLGMLIMYLFFAAIGLSTDVIGFVESALHLFFYALVLVMLHFILIIVAARVFRIDLAEAIVGSAAALVGPGPAAAIASSRGWDNLVTPGIMCGLFGYVIANFIGVSIVKLLG